jgi:hypothetical protein
MITAFELYLETSLLTSTIQAIYWAVMLCRAYRGTSYLYVKIIAWLLFISSVSVILTLYCTFELFNDPKALKWRITYATMMFFNEAGNCLSHWIFCFKYFKIGSVFKYFMAEEQTDVPKKL